MSPDETLKLCRIARGMCPQQAFDEYTPDAWHLLLAEARLEDALMALTNLARRQPFVAPSEILAEVKKIRAKRLELHPPLTPPAEFDGDPAKTNAWLRDARRRVADGELLDTDAAYGELKPRHLPDLRALTAPAQEDQ